MQTITDHIQPVANVSQEETMNLKIEDVVDCLGRGAFRKRGLSIDHLICYDPEGPPITLNPIRAVRPPIHGCQDLRRKEVLGPNRHCGSCHLKTHKKTHNVTIKHNAVNT